MATDLELIAKNQDARVIFTGGLNASGILIEPVNFGATSEWGSEGMVSSAMEMGNSLIGAAQTAFNLIVGADSTMFGGKLAKLRRSEFQLATPASSTVSWKSSASLSLNLNLLFINISGEDVRIEVSKMIQAVHPDVKSNLFGSIISAPGGYTSGRIGDQAGRIKVQIGRWFKSDPVYVVSSVVPSFSQAVSVGGLPLFANCSISLQPAKILGADDIK